MAHAITIRHITRVSGELAKEAAPGTIKSIGHLQNLQKLLSDFFRRRSKINSRKSNLMVLDHNGHVSHIADGGVEAPGKPGWYFRVLNCASENRLSSDT